MARKSKLRIIPLGGLNEIGKNMTVFEYGNDIMILDCGMSFPDEQMPGIDFVIPDFTYLEKNREKLRGLVITHGHEDHIGAIPYLLSEYNMPIYGTNLTLGLVQNKLKEHGILSKVKMTRVSAGDIFRVGCFQVEAIRTNHSIADSLAYCIKTPVGNIVHTGDFKVDITPIQGEMIDLTRFGELGKEGVLALMSDSTNVERPGVSQSERNVGLTLDNVFSSTKKRIIIATFASNVHRVQQIINAAHKCNRKVAVSGRSMLNVLEVAVALGYTKVPSGVLINIDDIKKYKPSQLVIMTTGSQGEPMSALYRMAFSDHRKVEITKDDLIVVSANPIPGNERLVSNVVNELFKKGAEVIYDKGADIHVSGHACQDELKMILALTKPKYFIPVHGEFRHLKIHAELGTIMGVDKKNVFIMDNGKVLEISKTEAKLNGVVPSGKTLIDGLGVGDVGNIVLRDRKHLAQDGLIVVTATLCAKTGDVLSGPAIISRGFVYVRESEDLMIEIEAIAKESLALCKKKHIHDWSTLKNNMKAAISDHIFKKTKRKPMILPVIMEV
ncbi:MAG: ribonuclease J [Ruminococcaceae bacterium]|nr:ribonuclease J [Oscillospiraceae bacterium]